MKNHMKIVWFIKFPIKPWLVQNHCVFIDGFIRAYNGTRYLVLRDLEKYDVIYLRIRQ